MASLREQVMARVTAALAAAAPGGASVSRSREVAITRANAPAIVVMPQRNSLERVSTELDKNQFDLAVEIFVRGDPWDQLADPIDTAAHAVLMTDAALLAMVSSIRRVSEAFESQEADQTAGTLTVHYRLTWLARATALSAAP